MSTEAAVPVDGSGTQLLRTLQQTTAAGTVQTEVVTDAQLTLSTISKVTVSSTSIEIIPASVGIRDILIAVPSTATTGICINFDAAATTNHFLIEPGGSFKANTAQQIQGIRAGAVDVTVYPITGVLT